MKARVPLLLLCAAALRGLALRRPALGSRTRRPSPSTRRAAPSARSSSPASSPRAPAPARTRPPREAGRRASLVGAGVKRDGGREGSARESPITPGASPESSGCSRRVLPVGGFACGLLLFGASWLQRAGIAAYPPEAAASSRSAFVTAACMVMVALVGIVAGKNPHPAALGAVASGNAAEVPRLWPCAAQVTVEFGQDDGSHRARAEVFHRFGGGRALVAEELCELAAFVLRHGLPGVAEVLDAVAGCGGPACDERTEGRDGAVARVRPEGLRRAPVNLLVAAGERRVEEARPLGLSCHARRASERMWARSA